jgi:hypothetical protein
MIPSIHAVRRLLAVVSITVATAVPAFAQQPPPAPTKADDKHRKEDISRHRTIAAAHEAAAQCLEAGRKESECHEALRKACQGVAVGKYCGMRHSH